MKKILVMLALLTQTSAFADQIVLDGSKNQFKANLKSTVYKTLYREETVEKTCYRDVFSHNEEVCSGSSDTESCDREPDTVVCGLTPTGQECNTVPGHTSCTTIPGSYSCSQVPRYNTESYSCYATESVPYKVYDYDLENEVLISVDNVSGLTAINEVLNVMQDESSLIISAAKTTGTVIIKSNQSTEVLSSSGMTRLARTRVDLKLYNKQVVYGPFLATASELAVNQSGLSMSLGQVLDPSMIKVTLFLERKRLIAKDELLINRTLKSTEYSLSTKPGKSVLTIDFAKHGIKAKVEDKKISATLKIESTFGKQGIVNTKDVPSHVSISKSIKQKLK